MSDRDHTSGKGPEQLPDELTGFETLPDELPEGVGDDAPRLLDPELDLDVTEPSSGGEPIHRGADGDVGEGAD